MYTVYVKYVYLQGDILLQWSDVNYKYKNIFLNEKMKPTIEPNQDKITTHAWPNKLIYQTKASP